MNDEKKPTTSYSGQVSWVLPDQQKNHTESQAGKETQQAENKVEPNTNDECDLQIRSNNRQSPGDVDTPSYYKGIHYGYEAHQVIEDFAGDNYNIGVAIAYLLRAGKKEGNHITQDIQKAIDHLNFELKRQTNKQQKE